MAGLNLLRYLLAWCGGMQPSSKMAAVVVKARGQAGAVRAAEFKMLTWGHPTLRISRIFFFFNSMEQNISSNGFTLSERA